MMKNFLFIVIVSVVFLVFLSPGMLFPQDDLDLDFGEDETTGTMGGMDTIVDTGTADPGLGGLDLEEDLGGFEEGLGFKIEKSTYEKKHNTKSASGDKDPFFPLVTKPQKAPPKKRTVQTTPQNTVQKPQQIIIPDIELKVICIVGNDTKRMALIEFEGKTEEYVKGDTRSGGFKIVDINGDSVVVYSLRKRRQRTFKLPE